MNNFNLDENSMNKLKDMMNNGDLSNILSQIPPEMMQNFSSMMSSNNPNNSNNSTNSNDSSGSKKSMNFNNSGNSNSSVNSNGPSGNFDFGNIDMNTILKMKSVMEKMNSSNDPRSNLLYSLKPYLREEKKEKLDQYANFLNMAKMFEVLKPDNKENNNNG